VRNSLVSVLEVCDRYQPKVHPQIGDEVVLDDFPKRKGPAEVEDDAPYDGEANVADDNIEALALLEYGGVRLEMVGSSLVILPGGVENEITRPTNETHENDSNHVGERRIGDEFGHILASGGLEELGAEGRKEHLISVHMSGPLVMHPV
jgi:hypothetical protein